MTGNRQISITKGFVPEIKTRTLIQPKVKI